MCKITHSGVKIALDGPSQRYLIEYSWSGISHTKNAQDYTFWLPRKSEEGSPETSPNCMFMVRY